MYRKKLLLVEGLNDEHVVKHLCGVHGGPWLDRVIRLEGIENLLDAIPTQIKVSAGSNIIGIVVDADQAATSRWQAIVDRLAASGYPNLPRQPEPGGTVIEPAIESLLSRFGIWIMPDNQSNGYLEHFLRSLVPADSVLFAHVEASVQSIPLDQVRFSPRAQPKVLLHTWLAWQATPGLPYGSAIQAGFLNAHEPQVDAFMAWLKRLYVDEVVS